MLAGHTSSRGVPSAESSHKRWSLEKRISRQPYPYKISLKFCKEAGLNPGPPDHKWRVSTTAPGHKLSSKELDRIRLAGFLVLIIHGWDDVVSQLYHARRLAEKLQPAAKLVELHGGHLVSHERAAEVNMSLMEMIKASKSNTDLEEWSNLPKKFDGLLLAGSTSSLAKRNDESVNYLIFTYNLLAKLQLILLFFFGASYVILEHARRVLRIVKPVRVSAATL